MSKIDYTAEAKAIKLAFEQDGAPAKILVGTRDDYDIITGKTTTTYKSYSTHAFCQNFSVADEPIVSPETVEISFHAGDFNNPLPDLMDTDIIKIEFDNKIYKALVVKVVRPAGVTLLYRVRAVEDKDEV